MSVLDYLEHYEATWAELMQNQDQCPLKEYGERSVLTTWKISYDQVKSINLLVAQLLDLWAFLYYGDVWAELVLAGQDDGAHDSSEGNLVLGRVTKLSLQHSIGFLVQYSLVNMSAADQSRAIHPVVHAWCLHNLGQSTAQPLYNKDGAKTCGKNGRIGRLGGHKRERTSISSACKSRWCEDSNVAVE
jgi:hypothetical protein